MRSIELSAQAEIRLYEITDYYLANESVERTFKVINSFNQAFLKIAASPFNCRKFTSSEFINLDIRFYLHYKTFHIYFVITENTIRIAEIFHLHQDGKKLKLDL